MAVPIAVRVGTQIVLDRRGRRVIAIVVGGLLFFVVLIMSLASSLVGGGAGGEMAASASGAIPPQFVELYNTASAAYSVNPYLLAAIHKVETGFSTNPRTFGVNAFGCCVGPFQMNVKDATWTSVSHAYKKAKRPSSYPHPTSSHPDPTDTFDAVMAAALLLRNKIGGRAIPRLDQTAWQAAYRYNGAGDVARSYADEVLGLARSWESASSSATTRPGSAFSPFGLGAGRLSWPLSPSTPITGQFGEQRPGHRHAGVDLAAPLGTPVYAADAGTVGVLQGISQSGGYGNLVCLQHGVQLSSCYAHLSRFAAGARRGLAIARGQLVGYVGNTGHSFGAHLHFEVRLNGTPVNPMPYLR